MQHHIFYFLSALLIVSFCSLVLCNKDGPAAPVSLPNIQIEDPAFKFLRQLKKQAKIPPPPQAAPFPILKKKDPFHQRFLQSFNGKGNKKVKSPVETGNTSKKSKDTTIKSTSSSSSSSSTLQDQVVVVKKPKSTATTQDRSTRTEL